MPIYVNVLRAKVGERIDMNTKKLTRLAISFIAIVGCFAFVVLSALNFDLSADTILSQLVAVILLILFIIGVAALTGYFIQKISNKNNSDDADG